MKKNNKQIKTMKTLGYLDGMIEFYEDARKTSNRIKREMFLGELYNWVGVIAIGFFIALLMTLSIME